ncbi:G-type lectin S-receptor-like serine/threonine-protein kinase SD2-5 [Canna indica]|uniref:G-type lectin S-receptor-like serine/threonine-protein kinase SD2-5 n=1 Tax=Canna indica TaxID=4628 RepID=A0AAQ3JMJ8_9LILI|nr:G-type lectin S-receptor-like serine/threonine-protein kinase SD2-5 [Canna indica]
MLSVSDHPLLRRCLLFLLPLFAIPSLVRAQWDYPSAKLSTVWINSNSSLEHTVSFPDGSQVRSILLRQNSSSVIGPTFACGFYCSPPCDTFLLAVFVVSTNSGGGITLVVSPRVVWSANRDHPVAENAVLNFTAAGDLVLHDSDGTVV